MLMNSVISLFVRSFTCAILLLLFNNGLNAQLSTGIVYPDVNEMLKSNTIHNQIHQQPFTHNLLRTFSERRKQYKRIPAFVPEEDLFTIGDIKNIYVRNIMNPQQWYGIDATLMILYDNVAIWMRSSEIEQYYDEEIFNTIFERLIESSGTGSIDEEKGIIEILNEYFGHPPNTDGSGLIHILFLDIPDNFEQTGGYVAGFFDPVNIFDHEFSNRMDLVYIDLHPTLYFQGEIHLDRTIATIAHEIQHLIHINYEGDEPQNLFINEGLSELAEIITGHQPRETDSYLRNFKRPLFSWNFENPLPDYSRASLFLHYVYERIGPEFINPLVQTTDVGEEAFKNILKQTTPITFDELFRDWGLTLFAQSGIPEHVKYSHHARNEIAFPRNIAEQKFPHAGSFVKGNWIHQPVTFPLAEQVELIKDQQIPGSEWVGLVYSPDGTEAFTGTLSSPAVSSNNNNHSSISLLFTQMGTASESGMITFMADGISSGTSLILAHGEGQPQAFAGNASFLMLNNGLEIGTIYNITEPGWIRSVRFKSIFLSELQGSELPQSTERSVLIDVYRFDDGEIQEKLIPTIHHKVKRPFGNLSYETVFLDHYYNLFSDYLGGLFVTIRSSIDSDNNAAIGMNLSNSGNTKSWIKTADEESWMQVSNFEVQNNFLDGWDAIIELEYVEAPGLNERFLPLNYTAEANTENMILHIQSPVPVDRDRSNIVARLPSGRYVSGKPILNDIYDLSVEFPVSVGGDYRFYGRLQEVGYQSKIPVEWQWAISDEKQFQVAQNYPNPFNPSTTIPFTLLETATVRVEVFDLLGRRVLRLQPDEYPSGSHNLSVDLSGLTSGSYFVRIAALRPDGRGNAIRTKKMMMIK